MRHTGIDGGGRSESVRRFRYGQRQCRGGADVDAKPIDVIGDVERYVDGYLGDSRKWFGRRFGRRRVAGGDPEQFGAGATLGEPMHGFRLPDQ